MESTPPSVPSCARPHIRPVASMRKLNMPETWNACCLRITWDRQKRQYCANTTCLQPSVLPLFKCINHSHPLAPRFFSSTVHNEGRNMCWPCICSFVRLGWRLFNCRSIDLVNFQNRSTDDSHLCSCKFSSRCWSKCYGLIYDYLEGWTDKYKHRTSRNIIGSFFRNL